MPKADQSDRLHWPLVLLNGEEEGVEGRRHSKVINHKVTGTTRQEKKVPSSNHSSVVKVAEG